MDILQAGLKHERYVTGLINNIYGTAYESKDFRTMQFLDWFVKEQGEEENKRSRSDQENGTVRIRSKEPVSAGSGDGCTRIHSPVL